MFSQWVTPKNLEDFDETMKLELCIKNILSSAAGISDPTVNTSLNVWSLCSLGSLFDIISSWKQISVTGALGTPRNSTTVITCVSRITFDSGTLSLSFIFERLKW